MLCASLRAISLCALSRRRGDEHAADLCCGSLKACTLGIQNKIRERANQVPRGMIFVIGNGSPRRHQEIYKLVFKHFAVSINIVFIASVLGFISLLCLCFLLVCNARIVFGTGHLAC